jgi:hypothetical protein
MYYPTAKSDNLPLIQIAFVNNDHYHAVVPISCHHPESAHCNHIDIAANKPPLPVGQNTTTNDCECRSIPLSIKCNTMTHQSVCDNRLGGHNFIPQICSSQCGNTCYNVFPLHNTPIQVINSPSGKAIIADCIILQDTYIIEYTGETITLDEYYKRGRENPSDINYVMYSHIDNLYIDAIKYGSLARYINHSCNPNCYVQLVKHKKNSRLIITALRTISLHEQITINYEWEQMSIGPQIYTPLTICLCGANNTLHYIQHIAKQNNNTTVEHLTAPFIQEATNKSKNKRVLPCKSHDLIRPLKAQKTLLGYWNFNHLMPDYVPSANEIIRPAVQPQIYDPISNTAIIHYPLPYVANKQHPIQIQLSKDIYLSGPSFETYNRTHTHLLSPQQKVIIFKQLFKQLVIKHRIKTMLDQAKSFVTQQKNNLKHNLHIYIPPNKRKYKTKWKMELSIWPPLAKEYPLTSGQFYQDTIPASWGTGGKRPRPDRLPNTESSISHIDTNTNCELSTQSDTPFFFLPRKRQRLTTTTVDSPVVSIVDSTQDNGTDKDSSPRVSSSNKSSHLHTAKSSSSSSSHSSSHPRSSPSPTQPTIYDPP